jgi:hypothetical protein
MWFWVVVGVAVIAALVFLASRRERRTRGSGYDPNSYRIEADGKYHASGGGGG